MEERRRSRCRTRISTVVVGVGGHGLKLKKCAGCGAYTMMQKHCGVASKTAHPPKFSVEDRYAKYRRMEKFGVK